MIIDIEPRYCELDVLGHITNTVIPTWFEHGRLGYFKYFSEADNYSDLRIILKKYDVTFEKEISISSSIQISTEIKHLGTSSITFRQEAYQKGDLVAHGSCVMVYFNYGVKKPAPLPSPLRSTLETLTLEEGTARANVHCSG